MVRIQGHGMDAVTDTRNEKARWAGTHRAVFVVPSRLPAGCACHGRDQQIGVTFERCMDGIDILHRRP